MTINIPTLIMLAVVLAVAAILSHPLIILLFLFLILLPGFLLTRLFLALQLPLEERLIVAMGMGIAAIAFISYLYKIVSVPLTAGTILAFFALLYFVALRITPSKLRAWYGGLKTFHRTIILTNRLNTFHIILITILFFSLLTRLYPIQHLEVPPFADPALQGTITQLIVGQEGIPDTWGPYAPLAFRHQPGFASIVAWFSLFSSLSIPKIILFLTNIIHALFPFFLYIMAYALFKNRAQSIIAALLGLIAIFPTSLFVAGANATVLMYTLVLLASALTILFIKQTATAHSDTLKKSRGSKYTRFLLNKLLGADWMMGVTKKSPRVLRIIAMQWKMLAFFVVLFTGAMLVHPTFIVFWFLIIGPYIGLLALNRKKFLKTALVPLGGMALVILISAAIIFPFFAHSTENQTLLEDQWNYQVGFINPGEKISPYFLVEPLFFLFNNPNGAWYFYLEDFSPQQFVASGAGIVMTALLLYALFFIWRTKNKQGYYLATLYFIFLLFSSLQSFFQWHFPGWNLLYPTRIKFLMILPIALLISLLFTKLRLEHFRFKNITASLPLLLLLLIVPYNLFSISNHLSDLSILSPYSESDKTAIRWIELNIPKDAMILNTIRDVESGVFIGGAGQWIPSLTGHNILFPPLSLTEDVLNPQITDRLTIMTDLEKGRASEKDFLEALQSYNVRYVFISPRMMHTKRRLFSDIGPEQFLASPHYTLAYQNEDTYVFSVAYFTPLPSQK